MASTPAWRASKAVRASSPAVLAVTITIGVGVSCMIRRVASSPFIRGMCISIVTTSGRSRAMACTASAPSAAQPATSSAGSASRRAISAARWTAESSTTSTRIGRPAGRRRRAPAGSGARPPGEGLAVAHSSRPTVSSSSPWSKARLTM